MAMKHNKKKFVKQIVITVVGLMLSCNCFSGCGPIHSTILQGDNVANYTEIFDEKKPVRDVTDCIVVVPGCALYASCM